MTTRTVCLLDAVDFLAPYDFEQNYMAQHGIDLRIAYSTTAEQVIAHAQDIEIALCFWHPFSRTTLAALPNCRLVLRAGVGYDNIDVAAATEMGIAVANSPEWCSEDVADHAAALIVAVSRRLHLVDHHIRAGGWPIQEYRKFHRLQTLTIGFVGFGRIGRATARKLSGFQFRYLVYDPYLSADEVRSLGAIPVDLDTLLAEADVVTSHAPLTAETRGMLGEAEFRTMKPSAFFVNTSRGPIQDEAALTRALTEGWLAGAGLDVFEKEPLPVDSPLRSLPNTLLTSHMAGYSEDALVDIRREMCDTAIEWFETGWSRKVVNPEVRERLKSASR